MVIDNSNYWFSPVRNIVVRAELFNGSALADAFTAYYGLKEFTIERVGEASKFFGFGVCQKLNIHLVDKDRLISINTDHSFKNYLGTGGELISPFPLFHVTEVHRDENTNELSVTAYDKLYKATEHTFSELKINPPYTILDVAKGCANLLGINGVGEVGIIEPDDPFLNEYPIGANFEGTETIREVLDAIAEATQTIYYINKDEQLLFKRLDIYGEPASLTITKEDYITLDTKTNRRLVGIVSATELGDNVEAKLDISGTVQYVRDNPFWDIQENVGTLVENALAVTGGLTINQFNCSWRGNAAIELGDKIELVTKDNNIVTSYILNDVIKYNGSLSQTSSWNYEDTGETENNPSTLGEVLKKTFARVDKANAEIDMVAGETTFLKLTTDSITSSISKIDDNISDLTNKVNTKVSAEDVEISIETALADGVDSVTTATGFTFNNEGLHINKSGSEITTSITEDGMNVYRNNDTVLTANNEGVKAEDLHATTYLIIGTNSRFEDYGDNRTGCFWIGE